MVTKTEIMEEFASKRNGECPRAVREIVDDFAEDDGGIYDMSSMFLTSGKRYMRREEVLKMVDLGLKQLISDLQKIDQLVMGKLSEYDGGFDLESI
jgi:hypothetical protein